MYEEKTMILVVERRGVVTRGTAEYCNQKRRELPPELIRKSWIQTEDGTLRKWIEEDK